MSRRRRKEQSSRPWWFNWPQLRLYLGLDCVWLLRYQRWGGCELLTWCPVSFLEGESFPYLPEEMKENWQMKRPPGAAPGGARHAAPPDQLAVLYPGIAEHLTSLQYDDDPPIPRETSTLLLFAQDGSYRACLRDRQEKRCLWVACTLWDELLLTLETSLEDPNAVWREDRLSGSDNAKRIQRPRG